MLFSRLGSWQGKSVLDLCSGTGALAIEALSRGAERAVLVDQDAQAEQLALQNLQTCRLADRAVQIRGRLPEAFRRLPPATTYDVVFLDPPYRQGLAGQLLTALAACDVLHPGSLVCVETGDGDELEGPFGQLELELQRDYGSTRISFYTMMESPT